MIHRDFIRKRAGTGIPGTQTDMSGEIPDGEMANRVWDGGILHIREKNTMIMQVYSREQETSRRNFCADTDSGGPGQCLIWNSK